MFLIERILSFVGLGKKDADHNGDTEMEEARNVPNNNQRGPMRVVAVQKPPEPILIDCPEGDGGIQGLDWYRKSLRMDKDGDVAHEFIEVSVPSKGDAAAAENQSGLSLKTIKDDVQVLVESKEVRDGDLYCTVTPLGKL